MQSLKALQHFVLAAETRNFRAAAELANVTSPALSNSIKTLEEQLGFQLFERSERPVGLTPQGKLMLEQARRILFESRNLDSIARDLRSGASGHVALGMTSGFSNCFGSAIAVKTMRDWPGITLEIRIEDTESLAALLRQEDVEMIVFSQYERPRVESEPGIEIVTLEPEPNRHFCRAGHPILKKDQPGLSDLVEYGLCTHRFGTLLRGSFAEYLRERIGHEEAMRFQRFQTDDNYVLLSTVLNTDLILSGARPLFRREQLAGQIVEIPGLVSRFSSDWCLAMLAGRALQTATHAIREQIEALVGADAVVSGLAGQLE